MTRGIRGTVWSWFLVLVLMLASPWGNPAQAQRSSRRSVTPLKRQLNTLGGKIRDTRSALRRVRRAEEEIARDLETVQERLRRTRDSLVLASERLESTRDRQRRLDGELETTRRR
ncbi:MAG: hypothetical protein ACOVT5_12320, partial [Armatimonadaceae bacterium]